MSRPIHRRLTEHTRRQASAALRFCAALWLVFQFVYTPIHLHLEPHSDAADIGLTASPTDSTTIAGDDEHDGDEHHERHPAAQHKFKVLRSEKAAAAEHVLVSAVEWTFAEMDCPQPQAFGFSGLSPPELPRCWQFLFRAALPVRAPSLLS